MDVDVKFVGRIASMAASGDVLAIICGSGRRADYLSRLMCDRSAPEKRSGQFVYYGSGGVVRFMMLDGSFERLRGFRGHVLIDPCGLHMSFRSDRLRREFDRIEALAARSSARRGSDG